MEEPGGGLIAGVSAASPPPPHIRRRKCNLGPDLHCPRSQLLMAAPWPVRTSCLGALGSKPQHCSIRWWLSVGVPGRRLPGPEAGWRSSARLPSCPHPLLLPGHRVHPGPVSASRERGCGQCRLSGMALTRHLLLVHARSPGWVQSEQARRLLLPGTERPDGPRGWQECPSQSRKEGGRIQGQRDSPGPASAQRRLPPP